MVYSLCIEANRTARVSSQPPSRLSEHKKKNMGVEGQSTKGQS